MSRATKQIALSVLGGLLASVLAVSPATAITYTWALGKPSQIVAYQVGGGVVTVATAVVLCKQTELILDNTKPFVYDFKIGTPKGILCAWGALSPPPYSAPIASYYQTGTPATVKVHTSTGIQIINVQPAPPESATTSHLPFH
jgi:hypothetical protein